MMTFGEALKQFRKAAKLTQVQLAGLVGLKQASIASVEVGKRNTFSKDTVVSLERALKLKPGELIQYLPADHAAHATIGTTLPDYGLVWGSPPRDVPEPTPGQTITLVGRFPADTFALRVSGSSIHKYGVHDGDVIAVRPTDEPEDGALVIARQGNSYTIKGCRGGKLFSFGIGDEAPTEIDHSEPFQVVGVMIGVVDGERRFLPKAKIRARNPAKNNGNGGGKGKSSK